MHHNHYSRNLSCNKNLTYSKSCKTCLKCKECILPGTAGDSLGYHNGMKFTTYDRDNDQYSGNCAVYYKGAWWYQRCHRSNLNGPYLGAASRSDRAINWLKWKRYTRSMKKAEMKIRPMGF